MTILLVMIYSRNNKRLNVSTHIKIKYLVGRDKVKDETIVVEHIGFKVLIVDPLTKGLAPKIFNEHVIKWVLLTLSTRFVNGEQVT